MNVGEQLVRALVGFPGYIFVWTITLVIAVLTDSVLTAIAILAVLVGVLGGNAGDAFVIFLSLYVLSRLIGLLAMAITQLGGAIVAAARIKSE